MKLQIMKKSLLKEPYTLRNIVKCICGFFSLWGTPHYYQNIDKPTFWQWLYKWRVSPFLAYKLATGIWFNKSI